MESIVVVVRSQSQVYLISCSIAVSLKVKQSETYSQFKYDTCQERNSITLGRMKSRDALESRYR